MTSAQPLSAEEIARLRDTTPGCARVRHFNHAGASLMPERVLSTVVDHLTLESTIGGYEAADEASARSDAVYDSVARLINATPGEIALVENATRAWDMAFYSIPFRAGDRILTAQNEYASNVIAFLQAREKGVSIEVIPSDESGQVSLSALANALDSRVRLVAITHVPTNSGLVQPVEAIGKLVRANGSYYLVDACQSAGQLPIDVAAIDCDFLSATSRKYLRGPRGAGFLFARRETLATVTPPFLDLHAARWVARDQYEIVGDARRFENWERNVAGLLGMGKAVDLALDLGVDRIALTVQSVADILRRQLSSISGVNVRDVGPTLCGIVTFDVAGVTASEVQSVLRKHAINTTTSSVYSTRYDMEARGLENVVRASVHYLTTPAEVDALTGAVERIARGV